MSFPTVYYKSFLPATRPGMQCACVSVSEPVYIGVLVPHRRLESLDLNLLLQGYNELMYMIAQWIVKIIISNIINIYHLLLNITMIAKYPTSRHVANYFRVWYIS